MATTQLVRLDTRSKIIGELFKVNERRILAAAPRSMGDPTRLLNIAFNSIAYNPDLLECTQQSLIAGVFEALKLGIALGGPMQEGWLIPFRSGGAKQATLIVGYQGYRNIIDRGGSVIDMHPRAVHNGRRRVGNEWKDGLPDEFDYFFGDNPRIIHRPRNPMPEHRDQLRAIYVVANLRKGGKQMEVLEPEEIEAHRNRSRAKDSGPWQTDYVPMALKTGMRKIAKYLPKSNELLARALDLDDRADRGDDQKLETPADITYIDAEDSPTTPPPASPMDRLKQAIGVPPAAAEEQPKGEQPTTELGADGIKW